MSSQRSETGTAPVGSTPILSVEGLRVAYGGVVAVDNVDLSFNRSQVCGLIGPNGAGKTTFLDCLSGLRTPTSGRVKLDGKDVTRVSPTGRSRMGVRRTFQRVQVFSWLTVEDNILMALEWRGGGGGVISDLVRIPARTRIEKQRRAEVEQVLELCGLADERHEVASRLTFGRARVLELARAIVDPPRILLLDEPTSGLDEDSAEMLASVIETLRSQHECAVILVEHDMRFVMDHCDRLVVLNLGSVLAEGPAQEVRNLERVATAYLG